MQSTVQNGTCHICPAHQSRPKFGPGSGAQLDSTYVMAHQVQAWQLKLAD